MPATQEHGFMVYMQNSVGEEHSEENNEHTLVQAKT